MRHLLVLRVLARQLVAPLPLQQPLTLPPAVLFHCEVFTHVSQEVGPLLITRLGQFPVATISFNLAPGVTLGEAVRASMKQNKKLACQIVWKLVLKALLNYSKIL